MYLVQGSHPAAKETKPQCKYTDEIGITENNDCSATTGAKSIKPTKSFLCPADLWEVLLPFLGVQRGPNGDALAASHHGFHEHLFPLGCFSAVFFLGSLLISGVFSPAGGCEAAPTRMRHPELERPRGAALLSWK